MSLSELQELERSSVIDSYARFPVEFVRGEGARLWDAEGNEYLDFLCGISVTSLGHCHPRVVAAVREQAGRLMHVEQPLLHRAGDAARASACRESSLGGKVFFSNSGAEAIEAAIKLRAQGAPGAATLVVAARRLPRAHLRRALGDPAGVQAGAVRAAGPRLPRGRADAAGARRRGRRQHGGGDARADPGRERRARALRRVPAGGARGLRRARRGAHLRRGPVRASGAPARCGPTSRPACARTRSRPPRRSAAACRSAR